MRRNGTLILCYHRVAEGVEDPFHLCVRPGNFAAHLEEMSRSREPSTLADVSVPSRRPRVVVTFDDGYRDNLTNALPIAESKGVPITFFVTSGILGNHNGFWWDRLGTLLRARPPHVREIDLPVGGRNVRLPLGSSGIRADLDSVRRHLLPLRVTDIERALDAVSEQWQVGSAPPPDAGTLTPEDLLPAGGQRHRDDRRPHGRSRPASGSSGTGAAGHHLWLQGGAGAVDRPGRVALRVPIWRPRRLRRSFGRRRAFGCVRHRVHHHPRNGPFLDRSLPPPSAPGHGLGTASFQSSDATMETWVSDAAPRECAGRGDELPDRPTVSVVICAYTERSLAAAQEVGRFGRSSDLTTDRDHRVHRS